MTLPGKVFRVFYRDEAGEWAFVDVEDHGIPPEWPLTPTLARIAARRAVDMMQEVIVASDDEYAYHLHPNSETKLAKFWDYDYWDLVGRDDE